jgi:ketopantoate reductase
MVAIAIVGPGAIGGTVAAELSRGNAHAITVCARTPFDRLEVDTPTGKLFATPRVVTDPGSATPVDWVLVATKAYDHAATAVWLRALVSEGTRVAILQNADRLAGRPMEVDARNGAVVRLGAKHGIPTPLNQAIVAMLDAVQPS